MRNQKTFAHYKDKAGHPRTQITNVEYEKLLSDTKLKEAYAEIFEYYSKGEQS